ncbi:MFS domain-containing protein [Fusarium keratoplasticum]|nr:MFS domain-containing protein [Fusarium keratoplasticum]
MEGCDTKILGSLYAVPAFQEAYGVRQPNGSYEISASWQSGLGSTMGVTSIFGMFLGGWATERFGFRKTMMAALFSMPPIIFIFFFAPSLAVFAVAICLFSLPLGIFQTVTTVYIADIMPVAPRPYLTSCYSLAWALGQLLNAVIFRGTPTLPAPWTYRVPFALQWFRPILIIIGVYLAPESPWWLVRQNRLDEAEAAVSRLTSELDIETQKLVSLTGDESRRTIVVMGVYAMQLLTGSQSRAFMTYFFLQAGPPTDQSFNITIVALTLSVLGVLGAMINPTAWNWGALTGFFWAGAGVLGFIFTFFMVPESKGRTTAEMDILFEQKAHVRKFKVTQVSITHIDGDGLP